MFPPSSTTSLLIVIFASNAGTINILIGSYRLNDTPSIKEAVSSPSNSSYLHNTRAEVLHLSVTSTSTGRILPVKSISILPVYLVQLLTCFTPGDRSTKKRRSNATTKMADRTILATSNYSSDGSTALALE
jgi:hypothetical protein